MQISTWALNLTASLLPLTSPPLLRNLPLRCCLSTLICAYLYYSTIRSTAVSSLNFEIYPQVFLQVLCVLGPRVLILRNRRNPALLPSQPVLLPCPNQYLSPNEQPPHHQPHYSTPADVAFPNMSHKRARHEPDWSTFPDDDDFIHRPVPADNGQYDDYDEDKPESDQKAGRKKIKIEFIQDKSRRHVTFSKDRKSVV